MYKLLLAFGLVAFGLPSMAQTVPEISNRRAEPAMVGTPSRMVEPPTSLTLSTALSMGLEANAELAAARRELQAVEASILQAGVLPNPAFEMGIEDTRRETRETTVKCMAWNIRTA